MHKQMQKQINGRRNKTYFPEVTVFMLSVAT